MNAGAGILRANALRLPLADESVDLIITSPPYFALRSYRDEGEHYEHQIGSEETPQAFLEALWAVTAECWRVLKPSGSMWVNLGDKYAGSGGHNNSNIGADPDRGPSAYNKEAGGIRSKSLMGLPWTYANGCIGAYPFPAGLAAPDGQRWILRAEVIWSKPNGLPESVTDRVRRSHEQWFHLVKSPRYFAAVDEVREAQTGPPIEHFGTLTAESVAKQDTHTDGLSRRSIVRDRPRDYNPLGKLPGSVWQIPSEPLLIPEAVQRHYDLPDHFAAFPQELPRRIILGWSPNGVCLECSEGRRPVVAKEYEDAGGRGGERERYDRDSNLVSGGSPTALAMGRAKPQEMPHGRANLNATVTGYACACADATAPTRAAVVADVFGGTGTTAMVARTLGRFGVSVDLSADYNRLARWRIWESGHGEKAAQRTWRENQGDLFGNAPSVHCEDVAVTEAL